MATTSTAATSLDDFNLHGTPYEAECSIGCGAYGTVCRALNLRTQNAVAIKRIPRAFAAATVVKRALREVRILRQLQAENIISVLDMFTVSEDPSSSGRDVYMVLDLMETDLHRIIASEQSLEDDHIRYFTYQLFRGLKYLHSGGIVHRDIKPSNLLINGDCLLRIADFGMARALASNAAVDGEQAAEYVDDSFMTQYVATRWYRAPELLLSLVDYDAKVDIWAAGCVLGEMILRRQLFPGRNVVQQVQMLVHYLGTPDDEVMDRIASELVRSWVEKCGRRQGSGWDRLLPPNTSPDAVQAMERLMVIAPWRRATAVEALQLPFVAKYHNEAYEPSCERRIVLDVDAIERLSPTEMKEALVAEAEHFERARRLSEDDAAVGRLSPVSTWRQTVLAMPLDEQQLLFSPSSSTSSPSSSAFALPPTASARGVSRQDDPEDGNDDDDGENDDESDRTPLASASTMETNNNLNNGGRTPSVPSPYAAYHRQAGGSGGGGGKLFASSVTKEPATSGQTRMRRRSGRRDDLAGVSDRQLLDKCERLQRLERQRSRRLRAAAAAAGNAS